MQNQVQQRREQLLRLLQADTFASVEALSERLRVSPLTVRRDLDTLQELGLVERVHGGARVAPAGQRSDRSERSDRNEISYYARRGSQVAEKQAIARAAVELLEPDEVVVVDASTSGLYFARAMPGDLALTLITYSAGLPLELAGYAALQVISTGGLLHRKSLCYLGEDAERAVGQYHARQAFFGAKGVALEAGCTDALLPEIRLKAALARQVEELVILADHTKLENTGLASFARLEQVHTLVTDAGADPRLVQAIRERGVRVIVAQVDEESDFVK